MKAQLNYQDREGRSRRTQIEVPDDVQLNNGGVSITQDRSLVLVEFRAPWNGNMVSYSYRNPNDLDIDDQALVDINHNLVIGRVVAFGQDHTQRLERKPAYPIYTPFDISEWA